MSSNPKRFSTSNYVTYFERTFHSVSYFSAYFGISSVSEVVNIFLSTSSDNLIYFLTYSSFAFSFSRPLCSSSNSVKLDVDIRFYDLTGWRTWNDVTEVELTAFLRILLDSELWFMLLFGRRARLELLLLVFYAAISVIFL